MPILMGSTLSRMIDAGQLIRRPMRDANALCKIEPASYDLRAGTILWKDRTSSEIQKRIFDESTDALRREVVTVLPGQMVFVVTHEELQLPQSVCATVYSRNSLQKRNILALNAGHIDPGYEGPIIIRLINLGATGWALAVGEPVVTVVFHTVEEDKNAKLHGPRTMEETVEAAVNTALQAFSNPFYDLYEKEINRQLSQHYSKVEADLKVSLLRDYVRWDQYPKMVMAWALLTVAGLVAVGALARFPWSYLYQLMVNWIYGKP